MGEEQKGDVEDIERKLSPTLKCVIIAPNFDDHESCDDSETITDPEALDIDSDVSSPDTKMVPNSSTGRTN